MAAIAAAQYGAFTRAQVIAAGATRAMIRRRLETGRWDAMFPGVYRLAGVPDSWHQALLAACLACGRQAVASYRAASRIWRVPGFEQGITEISVPRHLRRRLRGVIVHEARNLAVVDVTRFERIPVTTPVRTIIDVASLATRDELEVMLDDLLRRKLVTLPRLRWRLSELGGKGRRGLGDLQDLIEMRRGISSAPQSVFETMLLQALGRADLYLPVCQYPVRDGGRHVAVVDFAYPERRLAIEAEGYRWHSGRPQWQHDLERGNRLTLLGWRVLRVTWADLTSRPDKVTEEIRRALGDPL